MTDKEIKEQMRDEKIFELGMRYDIQLQTIQRCKYALEDLQDVINQEHNEEYLKIKRGE